MQEISRRTFLKSTATGAGALTLSTIFPGTWISCSQFSKKGYFEKEFGITSDLCKKALLKALSKGGDFADLYFEHTISNWIML